MSDAAQAPADAWIGRVIDGRYQIVSKLGEGGMGAVFEAEQIALQRRVALKVIHPTYAGNGEVRARFAREAMASGQLDGHPHVATALDFGTLDDGSLYLVMQLVKGPSLRDVLDNGRLPWERATMLGAQVADALSAAHAAGIVHRDLKPDNVALVRREDGREIAKVLDFGIARITSEGAEGSAGESKLTRIGTVIGTPGYMAPEQAVGDSIDLRADLYSLGVMLFEMIVGRLPFDGPDLSTILALQFAGNPPSLVEASGDASIPEELDAIVQTLLARTAAERPESAGEIHRALTRLFRASELPDDNTTSRHRLSGPDPTGSRTTSATHPTLLAQSSATMNSFVEKVGARISAQLPVGYRPHARAITYFVLGLPVFLLLVGLVVRGSRGDPAPTDATAAPGMLAAAATAVHDVVAPPPEPSPAVLAAITTLATSDVRTERTAAADVLAAATPGTPAFAVKLSELERARGCRARSTAITELSAMGDARARPYLERLSRSPRRGCGFLGSRDCDACIRSAVRDALVVLPTQ